MTEFKALVSVCGFVVSKRMLRFHTVFWNSIFLVFDKLESTTSGSESKVTTTKLPVIS